MTGPAADSPLARRFEPVLADLVQQSAVADGIVDRDFYRILVCTLWVNVVLDPRDIGLAEADLEPLHDILNQHIGAVLGTGESLTACFRYLNDKPGEQAMKNARLTPNHRDMLLYFASIILDPEGHRRWMDEIRNPPAR